MLRKSYLKNKHITEKSKNKQLEYELDKLSFEIVKLRDRKCVQCGAISSPTPGHVFSRRVRSTRWNLDNLYLQCSWCNGKHELDRQPFYNKVKQLIGNVKFEQLQNKWNRPKKLQQHDLLEIQKNLIELRDELKINKKFRCELTYIHHYYLHKKCIYCLTKEI
jgi:hypothetical protein